MTTMNLMSSCEESGHAHPLATLVEMILTRSFEAWVHAHVSVLENLLARAEELSE
jgi:hypothetical protein